ncbi:Uncharacterized protein OBRU01_07462 [Operophtera brumata]|uniref:Uncharacterized protein n=1 Tax=Operophtera brumata TaxID=104452 RepID=A0A0L7LJZ9_OPEBR|nr:Uncharacterized protein OBRU01_07462 [Operophtera brumata]
MEFFGVTSYGPQNYIKDVMKAEYHEPINMEDAIRVLQNVEKYSTLPKKVIYYSLIRQIDCYLGRVNGFAYGSTQRFIKMKRKGVIKPVGPCDMFKVPPTTSFEYGWWQHDAALLSKDWYRTTSRFPQQSSPNTLILDKVRKNNKYATLF